MPAAAEPRQRGDGLPFVGRQRERTLIRHLIGRSATGRSAIVLVTGVPGSGKTALLGWTARAASGANALVFQGSAYAGGRPLEVMRRLLAPVPSLVQAVTPEAPGRTRHDHEPKSLEVAEVAEVAEVVASELRAVVRRRPTVLVLDDSHDMDAPSQAVLDHLLAGLRDVEAPAEPGLLVVLAARDPIPQEALAGRIARNEACRTITLGGLDEHDVYELYVLAGLRPEPERIRDLMKDTGGLPLLVEAQVRLHEAAWTGAAGPSGNRSTAAAPRHARVRSMADALQVRLDEVDDATGTLLTFAAALGDPWDPDDLALVSRSRPAAAASQLAQAERAKIVERVGDGLVRFAHPLLRTELLGRLSKPRRCHLHRSIADRLRGQDTGDTGPDADRLLRVAHHLMKAGDEVPWAEFAEVALPAARAAMRSGAYPSASQLFSAVVDRRDADHAGDADAKRATLLLEAGTAAYFDHDPPRCMRHLAAAVRLAERAGDQDRRARAATLLALARSGSDVARLGQRLDVSELEAALRVPGIDPALRVEGAAVLADTLLMVGDTERALAIVADARRAVAAVPPRPALDDSLSRLEFSEGIHLLSTLELGAASDCFARSRAHAVAASNTLRRISARVRTAVAELLRGGVVHAAAELEGAVGEALARGYWGEAGLAAGYRAACLALMGHADAVDTAEQALRLYHRTGGAYLWAATGPVLAALTARTQGRAWSASVGEPSLGSAVAVLSAVEANDIDAARARVRSSRWRHGFRGPAALGNMSVLAAAVEAGDRLEDSALVASTRRSLEHAYQAGILVTIGWPTLVPRLLAVAARHAGDYGEARRYLDLGLAVIERQGLDAERPKAFLELGRLDMAAGGSATSATALLGQAVAGFDRQSMHGWIARAETVAQDLGLTPSVGSSRVTVRERTVFTSDIVGSTAINARLGDVVYLEQLRQHDSLVRSAIRRHRGMEIKHTGDGLNAVFDAPAEALRCAMDVRLDIARWQRAEPELAFEIRCGLARGRLVPYGGDFFGLVQSEAARLCSLAAPGEVLASAAVVDGLDVTDQAQIGIEPVGKRHLRGLPTPTLIYRLETSGGERRQDAP